MNTYKFRVSMHDDAGKLLADSEVEVLSNIVQDAFMSAGARGMAKNISKSGDMQTLTIFLIQ